MCHPKNANYTHASELDQWGIVRMPSSGGQNNTGFYLRAESDGTIPTGAEESYAIRCDTNVIIRSCTGTSTCNTINTTAEACNTSNDTYGMMVAGTGESTEFCVWFWGTGGPTIDGSTTPSSWGNATECFTKAAHTIGDPMTLLADYEDCDGADTTVCEQMDATEIFVDASDSGDLDFSLYRGNSGAANINEASWGNLGL